MAEPLRAVQARAARAWSEDELAGLLGRCGPRSVILDLARRGLQPFFGAEQVCRQIGLEQEAMLAGLPPVLLPMTGEVGAEHVGSWIDFELFGDAARIVADRVSRAAAARGVDHLLVLMPSTAEHIPRADGLLLAGLAQGADTVTLAFPGAPYALPEAWAIRCRASVSAPGDLPEANLPPGPLSHALRTKLALLGYAVPGAVTAPNGWSYFAAAQRYAPEPDVPQVLRDFAADWGWTGLAFTLDTLDAGATAALAWQAMAAHDSELAITLAERASRRPGDQAFARTALATLCIIDQDYERIGEIAAGSQTDRLNRAWGSTLAGDAASARAEFDHARPTENAALALYRRNITALAEFRTGNVAQAWAHQRGIRDTLERMDRPSPHLRFVNALNMARLARSEGDRAAARAYLETAFAARGDGLSEHDLLYREVLRAGIAVDKAEARRCWQRAKAIFEAQTCPGAIPKRAFRTIVGRLPERFEAREQAVGDTIGRHAAMPEIVS